MKFVLTKTRFSIIERCTTATRLRQIGALILVTVLFSGCSTGPKVRGDATIPVNVAPKSGVQLLTGTQVEFIWAPADNATHYDFHIFDRTNAAIAQQRSKLLAKDVCQDGLCSITETVAVPVHPGHWWRVRATNYLGVSSYNRSYFDMVSSKAVTGSAAGLTKTALPSVPAVIAPTSGDSLVAGSKATFQWAQGALATVYDFHIFNTADGTSVKRHTDVPATTICNSGACELPVIVDLPLSDRHFWKVRAGNSRGKSNWKTTRIGVTAN